MRRLLVPMLLAALPAAAQDRPELTVYAPDYFASEWGPGPGIEEGFEARCGCDLVWKTGDVLPRLLLEGETTEADVVIGLTGDQTARARESGLLAPHGQDMTPLTLPVEWTDPLFLPFNWSYTAFVYDRTRVENPPRGFLDLADFGADRVVIQDPRSSAAGLALVLWVKALFGDNAEATWEKIAPSILTVTQDWSSAYGLFTEGEADMVLSFTTSPAYHLIAEEDDTKAAAIFPAGHYLLVELTAKVASTDDPDLADAFLAYTLSREFQELIPTTNWSYPAALPREDWPEAFRALPMPEKPIFLTEEKAGEIREEAIEEWRRALSR